MFTTQIKSELKMDHTYSTTIIKNGLKKKRKYENCLIFIIMSNVECDISCILKK